MSMSGHSKWSKVKHQKAVSDVVKGKLFTKAAAAITIAVREGGGVSDVTSNFKLRLAIEKARAVNMPKENIDRAIVRAAGLGNGGIETIVYEGFGPGGVAILIDAVTDNRQRTAAAVRNVLEMASGKLGPAGYLFERMDVGFRPTATIPISDADKAKLDILIEKLEVLDDVHRVFTNVEEG